MIFTSLHFISYKECSTVFNTKNIYILDDVAGSDQERETTKLTALPPARMLIPTEIPVIQIACGLHHNGIVIIRKI